MKTPADTSFCADRMKVLSDVTRLSVLEELLAGPKIVSELMAALRIDQSLLSHHLKVLRDAGLVVARREGKSVRYGIASGAKSGASGKGINLGCCQVSFEGRPGRKPAP